MFVLNEASRGNDVYQKRLAVSQEIDWKEKARSELQNVHTKLCLYTFGK